MGEEDVRTLFIAGLPEDVKEREIRNLFRTARGFEACQLKYAGRGFQVIAFAVFSDKETALEAKEAFHGFKFDPSSSTTLHIELAKSNSRGKRSRTDNGPYITSEKKARVPAGVPHVICDSGVGGTMHMTGLGHPVYSDMSGYPPSQSGGGMMGGPYGMQDGNYGLIPMGPTIPNQGPAIANPLAAPGTLPPCSTLFVSNLGQRCTEGELTSIFSTCPGLVKIMMQTRGGFPVAFVEYQDELCSTQAMAQLRSAMLPSSEHGGISIEYARSKMGLPRRRL